MLNIKTAEEARQEWYERAEREVEKAINEAQANWEIECVFFSHLPRHITKQLREKGYRISDEENGVYVSWV